MKKVGFIILISGFLFSCMEESEFKIPVDIQFYVDMIRNSETNEQLYFSEGSIILGSFEFEGEREQAEMVEFAREYENGFKINFDPNKATKNLHFQIPQGIYTSIEVSFETYEETDQANLFLKGIYKTASGKEIPFHFQNNVSIYFEIEAEGARGHQIVLKKEDNTAAYVKLDPFYWFQPVTTRAWEEAELVEFNGLPTIMISEEYNENIFELIINRIEDSADVIFED